MNLHGRGGQSAEKFTNANLNSISSEKITKHKISKSRKKLI